MKLKTIVLFIVALCLWASTSLAGTIDVHDSVGFLSTGDVQTLRDHNGNWPFDVHLLAESASSMEALESDAHRAVTSSSVMVIAVDPAHHKTVVRFGTATGVKTGDYDSISKAGNAHFRSGENEAGVEAILARARASKESIVAMSSSNAPVIIEHGLSTEAWVGIVALFVVFVVVLWWLYTSAKRDKQAFSSPTPFRTDVRNEWWSVRSSAKCLHRRAAMTVQAPRLRGARTAAALRRGVTRRERATTVEDRTRLGIQVDRPTRAALRTEEARQTVVVADRTGRMGNR